ncbi:MAG TPA: GNAT family N-acetyltransferase [Solirubrobacteraceae bacterium]|nr:GNAT family N-acetyltransferase [Solirubrobacteraceae bacterium]
MSELRARELAREDVAACIAVMRSNTPLFFAPQELAEYEGWMRRSPLPYIVVTSDEEIVACGGYRIEPATRVAGLTWGMVRRDAQRRGAGTFLLRERLARIRAAGALTLELDTSQRSRAFFERFGFAAFRETADGYAPGLDRIEMRLAL